MKSKDLAFILLRTLSIYIFIQAIMNLSHIINYSIISNLGTFKNAGYETNISVLSLLLTSIAPFLILLIIAIILWIFTSQITKYLLPEDLNNDENEKKINLEELQYIAFSIIGVLILSSALPQLFNLVPNIIKMNDIGSSLVTSSYKTEVIFAIIEKAVRVLIGLFLIFGSKGLVGLLKKIRGLGVKD